MEGFRESCIGSRSRLGGAAKLSEDAGVAWSSFRLGLAFSGEATLLLTRQSHALHHWLAFCGVSLGQLVSFRVSRRYDYPLSLFVMEKVLAKDDLMRRTANKFVAFVNSVVAENQDNAVQQQGIERQRKGAKSPRAVDARCADGRFFEKGSFLISMPVLVQSVAAGDSMSISSDESSYVEFACLRLGGWRV